MMGNGIDGEWDRLGLDDSYQLVGREQGVGIISWVFLLVVLPLFSHDLSLLFK